MATPEHLARQSDRPGGSMLRGRSSRSRRSRTLAMLTCSKALVATGASPRLMPASRSRSSARIGSSSRWSSRWTYSTRRASSGYSASHQWRNAAWPSRSATRCSARTILRSSVPASGLAWLVQSCWALGSAAAATRARRRHGAAHVAPLSVGRGTPRSGAVGAGGRVGGQLGRADATPWSGGHLSNRDGMAPFRARLPGMSDYASTATSTTWTTHCPSSTARSPA